MSRSRSHPAAQTKGHSAANPGLRGHSCGEFYPWLIVGVGGWPGTQWRVQHAIDGTVLTPSLAQPRFRSIRAAEKAIRDFNARIV